MVEKKQSIIIEEKNKPSKEVRLPKYVVPIKYDITIKPDIENFSFNNEIVITILIDKQKMKHQGPLDKIDLHMKWLEIESVQIQEKDEKIWKDGCVQENQNFIHDTYSIVFEDHNEKFYPDTFYDIKIKYRGTIYENKDGMFVNLDPRIRNQKNKSLTVQQILENTKGQNSRQDILDNIQLCTQFEPAEARAFMPCFDEPALKAKFVTRVFITNKNFIALSNTESQIISTEEGNLFEFEETPIMSTYLFVLVIGQFDYISTKTNSGVEIKGYTAKGKASLVQNHLDIAVNAIEYCEVYYDMPYPLGKLDFVSYHVHQGVAMENWGCITFHSANFENDISFIPTLQFQRNASLVVHEISHQWFGNKVTIEWWDDIWLNEGFARFSEYFILDQIRSEFKVWEKFLNDVYLKAIQADSCYAITHPVSVEVPDPDDLLKIFDTISYNKGSSLCRMLKAFVDNEQIFQNALRVYMQKFNHKNATTYDLLNVLDEVTQKDCTNFLLPWIKQKCLPELIVKRINENTYKIKQRCYQNQDKKNKGDQLLWQIDIKYKTTESNGNQIQGQVLLKDKQMELTIPGLTNSEQVRFNKGQFGFYVVNYKDINELKQLLKKNQQFDEFDRFGILFDYDQTQKASFEELYFFKDDESICVWMYIYQIIKRQLNSIDFESQKSRDNYFQKIKGIIRPSFNRFFELIYSNNDYQENHFNIYCQILSMHIWYLAIVCNDSKAQVQCTNLFNKFFENGENRIPTDLREPLYIAACQADQNCAKQLLDYYIKEREHLIQIRQQREINMMLLGLYVSGSLEILNQVKDSLSIERQNLNEEKTMRISLYLCSSLNNIIEQVESNNQKQFQKLLSVFAVNLLKLDAFADIFPEDEQFTKLAIWICEEGNQPYVKQNNYLSKFLDKLKQTFLS